MIPRKQRLLLIRNFRHPTGGNRKVRDYFAHACLHPTFDARVWFPPESRHEHSDIWAGFPRDLLVEEPVWEEYDFVCVNGKDWAYLPTEKIAAEIIHFVQHLGYVSDPLLRGYLGREARRICTHAGLRDAIAPYAAGPIHVVPASIDDELFTAPATKIPGRVLIHGRKQPGAAAELELRLRQLGIDVHRIGDEWIPHSRMISMLHASDVLVALPCAVEGFFLPPLEGMASGCVVVCSDAVGNRGHCIDGETCLQPRPGDLDGHVEAVRQALTNQPLRTHLRAAGRQMAEGHTMSAERAAFHTVLTEAAAESAARKLKAR